MINNLTDAADESSYFSAYADRSRLLRTIIGSSLLVLIAVILALMAATTSKLDGPDIGVRIFPILLCSVFLIFLMPIKHSIKRWRHVGPEIYITDTEIYVWMWSDTPIPFSNIHEVLEHQVSWSKMISLKLINPALNPPRRKRAKLFDYARDLNNTASNMIDNPAAKIAAIALSPAAAISLSLVQNYPDHRDPLLVVSGTIATHKQLIDALDRAMMSRAVER